MDSTLTDLLVNLKVLSNIGVEDKLLTAEKIFNIHPPSAFRTWYRFYYREASHKNISDIENCIRASFEHQNSVRIIHALKSVPAGLERLSETYKHDATLTSRISVLIENISLFIDENEREAI